MATLAKEFGVPARELVEQLNAMGEYVRSAASVIEAPVVRKLREMYPDAPPPSASTLASDSSRGPTPIRRGPILAAVPDVEPVRRSMSERMRDPFDPLHVASKPVPRGPYKGDPPTGLKRLLLDHYVVPNARRSGPGARRPQGNVTYWASEVAEAEELTTRWAPVLLDGMSQEQILGWIDVLSAASAEHAAALFAEGVDPEDLEFDIRYDLGRPSIPDRLVVGNMTVEQVVAEVRRRRAV